MEHEQQTDAGPQPAPDSQTGSRTPRRRAAAPAPSVEAQATPWFVPKGMSLAEHFGRFQVITDQHMAALRAPLPAGSVQSVKGKDSGKKYDSTGHGYQWVADRLSEVFGPGGWTETHDNLETTGTWGRNNTTFYHLVCRMTLSVGHWVAQLVDGIGLVPVFIPSGQWISYGEHRADNRGDARKGSQTNALKKVAAYALGVGADAFRGTIDDDFAGTKPPDDLQRRQQRPAATPNDRAAIDQAQAGVRFIQATRPGPCCLCDEPIFPGLWVAYPVAHPYTGKMRAAHRACYDREFPEKGASGRQRAANGSGGPGTPPGPGSGTQRPPAAAEATVESGGTGYPVAGQDDDLGDDPDDRDDLGDDPDSNLPF